MGAGVPRPSRAKRTNESTIPRMPATINTAPKARVSSLPRSGSRSSQCESHHGMSPATTHGAATKKSAEPKTAVVLCKRDLPASRSGAGVCSDVARLVEPELTTARKPQRAQEAPALIADCAASYALLAEPGNLHLHIVAHQIKLMLAVALSRVAGKLRRRSGKDKPAAARIDDRKTQHVAEESAVRLRVTTIDNRVHACDHCPLHRMSDSRPLGAFRGAALVAAPISQAGAGLGHPCASSGPAL